MPSCILGTGECRRRYRHSLALGSRVGESLGLFEMGQPGALLFWLFSFPGLSLDGGVDLEAEILQGSPAPHLVMTRLGYSVVAS